MKFLQVAALVLCTASMLLTGCRTASSCCADESMKSDCGMACCADGKTDCAHCPTCSAKK